MDLKLKDTDAWAFMVARAKNPEDRTDMSWWNDPNLPKFCGLNDAHVGVWGWFDFPDGSAIVRMCNVWDYDVLIGGVGPYDFLRRRLVSRSP